MKANDNFTSLLLPDETVLWSAQSDNRLAKKMSFLFMAAIGLFFSGLGVLLLWDRFFSNSDTLSSDKPIIIPMAYLAFGAFTIYSSRTQKIVLDAPSFRLSQRRAFVSIARKDRVETTVRFIQPGRLIQVIKKGQFFDIHIPVRPEFPKDHGFMTFNRLSQSDLDAALLVINSALGTPNPTAPNP